MFVFKVSLKRIGLFLSIIFFLSCSEYELREKGPEEKKPGNKEKVKFVTQIWAEPSNLSFPNTKIKSGKNELEF